MIAQKDYRNASCAEWPTQLFPMHTHATYVHVSQILDDSIVSSQKYFVSVVDQAYENTLAPKISLFTVSVCLRTVSFTKELG